MGSHKAFIEAWPGGFWPSACCIYTLNVSSSLSSHTSFCPPFFFSNQRIRKNVFLYLVLGRFIYLARADAHTLDSTCYSLAYLPFFCTFVWGFWGEEMRMERLIFSLDVVCVLSVFTPEGGESLFPDCLMSIQYPARLPTGWAFFFEFFLHRVRQRGF